MWAHSEKDNCAKSNDEMVKDIYMADMVAALEHKNIKTIGNTRLPAVQVETLELKNIMNEIISMIPWHFRSAPDLNLPILNKSADYQHRMQLKNMTATRYKANNVQRWPTTALEFNASVHKPKEKSYWKAAR
jgi:hypothetical protein